jgi:predicted dinucleotide-binding enzyme
MKVAILGTGMVGRIIAIKVNQLGHQATIGTRDPEKTLANTSKDNYGNPPYKDWSKDHQKIGLADFATAVSGADVIFNCTSGQASLSAIELASKGGIDGKTLIDIANPLDFSKGMPPSLNPVNTDSLGEQIQRKFPALKVVKALNSMNAGIMVNPGKIKGDHHVFICGNDDQAKAIASGMLKSFGWKESMIIDLGDITNARGTEMLLPIWLRLWQALGTAEFNFHIQRN